MSIGASVPRLDLSAGLRLGEATSIEADRIEVALDGSELGAQVTVSDLVALPAGDDYLIGIASALARRRAQDTVAMRVMPIGSVLGDDSGRTRFRPGALRHPHVGAGCHLVDGERLRELMSILGDDVAEAERLVLGHFLADRESPAIANGNRLLQRHVAVVGNTGAGKSWTAALLLERASRLPHANLVVLDLHGEYAPLCSSHDGRPPIARRLRVAGPADLLVGDEDTLYIPYWLLERDELLSLVVGESDPYASDQRLALSDRVQTLKRSKLGEHGHADAVSTATADSPVPYQLSHLLEWLGRDEGATIIRQPSGKVDPGPFNGKLGGLISRLETLIADPRYGFIFHPPEATESFDWLTETAEQLLSSGGDGGSGAGIKVVDLSEVPAPVLPLICAVLTRLVYNVQFWMEAAERTPICIVCDEAHVYMPAGTSRSPIHQAALDAFETIAKEGRKYGVCLAIVSQRPSDVSRTILSQCNNFIVMRLTNDEDQDVIGRAIPGALTEIRGLLPMLDVGEARVIGDALLMPTRIKLDPPSVKPAGATLPYWSMWSDRASSPGAIAAGVDALRNRWRGEVDADPAAPPQ
jgi:hypothetical protein